MTDAMLLELLLLTGETMAVVRLRVYSWGMRLDAFHAVVVDITLDPK